MYVYVCVYVCMYNIIFELQGHCEDDLRVASEQERRQVRTSEGPE